jgi:hypothetical protein
MSYAVDASEIKIGSAKVWADNGGGNRAIGFTLDDVVIRKTAEYHDTKAGQLGSMIIDKKLIGESAEVEFSMLQTNWDNLKLALPMSTVYTGTGTSLGIGNDPYGSLLDKAIKLTIHPINQEGVGGIDDETFLDDDVTLWKCANAEGFELPFKSGDDKVYKIKMTVFPDTAKSAGMYLGIIGDPANTTLDTTPPTLSATVGVYADKTGPTYTAVVRGTELTDVLATSRLKFVFSEALEASSAENYKNYVVTRVDTDVQLDISGETISYDPDTFTVTITALTLVAEKHYSIGVSGVKDVSGNVMIPDVRRILIAA